MAHKGRHYEECILCTVVCKKEAEVTLKQQKYPFRLHISDKSVSQSQEYKIKIKECSTLDMAFTNALHKVNGKLQDILVLF